MAASAIIANLASPYLPKGFVKPEDADKGVDPLNLWDGKHGAIYLGLDCTINESPEFEAAATQIPVEDGAVISDHVILKPVRLSIQGIVTNTPVSLVRAFSSPFSKPSPSEAAFTFLRRLRDNRIPTDYVGGLAVYKSMIVSSFKPVRTDKTGDSLQFTMMMEQIQRVSSEVVPVYKLAAASKKKASGKQSLGTQKTSSMNSIQSKSFDSFQSITPTMGF